MPNRDYEAFLHIIHVSDMHCRDGSVPTSLRTEYIMLALIRALQRAGMSLGAEWLADLWDQGLAGHDAYAHEHMCQFLHAFAADPQFGGIPTWLLDTGDLTSMGDPSSLKVALKWLAEYRGIVCASEQKVLYGNHDAWPCTFPAIAPQAEHDRHRRELRQGLLPAQWPQGPLSKQIPGSESRVLLSGVNSTIDDRWYNSCALGRVGADPAWDAQRVDQMTRLAEQTAQGFNQDPGTRDFRILAVHHPVHYPPPRPRLTMHMRNVRHLSGALVQFDRHMRGKLAHLVLSGHTHHTFPRLGALPAHAAHRHHPPLTIGQLQLIAGSLSQMPRERDRSASGADGFVPHQFQILTFFAPPARLRPHARLLIERRIVGRPGGVGPYKILQRAGAAVEAVLMEY